MAGLKYTLLKKMEEDSHGKKIIIVFLALIVTGSVNTIFAVLVSEKENKFKKSGDIFYTQKICRWKEM